MSDAPTDIRILLVEDEMIVASMLQGMLSALGYKVAATVSRIQEALRIIERERIDAVVLDINLDGEMSYPIADELALRSIPFIFSTGYGRNSLPDGYAGFSLLKKPFRRVALADALRDILQPEAAGSRSSDTGAPEEDPAAEDSRESSTG